MRTKNILILGLGNTVLSDDGVGIYVAREIRKKTRVSNVTVAEASLGGLELLELMKGFDRVVLIDAVVTGKHRIGTFSVMRPDDLPGGSAMTRHQIGLKEALELGKRLHMHMPEEVIIYGIEAADIVTFGDQCTPGVGTRIGDLAGEILSAEGLMPVQSRRAKTGKPGSTRKAAKKRSVKK